MNILVITRSEDVETAFRAAARAEPTESMVVVTTVEEAYRRLDQDEPEGTPSGVDAVFLDASVANIPVVQTCQRIRSLKALRDVPVVVVSNRGTLEDLDEVFNAGAMDHVCTPIRQPELVARIRSAVRYKREVDLRRARERELSDANRTLQRLSFVDDVTGALNRRAFDRVLAREYRRAVRAGCDFSVIMISVDNFDAYYDAFGVLDADDCLAQVVEVFNNATRRAGDSVARYGEHGFAVVLADTSAEGALLVAEKIRADVEALKLEQAKGAPFAYVTISGGVATARASKEITMTALLSAAIGRLSEASLQGGNCIKTSAL